MWRRPPRSPRQTATAAVTRSGLTSSGRRRLHMPAPQFALHSDMASCRSNFSLPPLSVRSINQSSSSSPFPGDGCFFAISSGSRGRGGGAQFSPSEFLSCSATADGIIVFPSSSSSLPSHLPSSSSSTQPRHLFHFHRFSHSQWMTEREGGREREREERGFFQLEQMAPPDLSDCEAKLRWSYPLSGSRRSRRCLTRSAARLVGT